MRTSEMDLKRATVTDEALAYAIEHICTKQILERLEYIETIYQAGISGLEALTHLLRTGNAREKGIAIVQIPRMLMAIHGHNFSQIAFEDLLAIFESSDDAQFKRRLLRIIQNMLSHVTDKQILSRLFFTLLDDDPDVRRMAIQFVNAHRLNEATPYLSLLLDDESLAIQANSRESLAFLKTVESLFALREWEKRQKRLW